MLYAVLPDGSESIIKSDREIRIETETIKIDLASTDFKKVVDSFILKTRNEKERSIISAAPFDLGIFAKKPNILQKVHNYFQMENCTKLLRISLPPRVALTPFCPHEN